MLEIDFNEIESNQVNPKPTFIVKNTNDNNLIDFTHKENYYIDFDTERLLPQMFSNEGPCVSNYDLNDDGISHRKEGGLKLEVSYETLQNGSSKVFAKLV